MKCPITCPQSTTLCLVADYFVAIGTSGNVYPAAGFVQTAKAAGARCIELNLEKTSGEHFFDDSRYGPASKTVPGFLIRFTDGGNDVQKIGINDFFYDGRLVGKRRAAV